MECFNYSLDRFFECINIWVDSCLMIRESPYRKLCRKLKIELSAHHFHQTDPRTGSFPLRHSSSPPLVYVGMTGRFDCSALRSSALPGPCVSLSSTSLRSSAPLPASSQSCELSYFVRESRPGPGDGCFRGGPSWNTSFGGDARRLFGGLIPDGQRSCKCPP